MTDTPAEFKNPYEVDYQSFAGPDKNVSRAPASIGAVDYDFIRGIRPNSGTVNTTQCLLWFKLVQLLKKHGITDITKKSEFESLVANLILVDGRPGSTVSRDGGKAAVGNDRRGVEETHPGDTDVANGIANAKGKNVKRQARGKGNGGKSADGV